MFFSVKSSRRSFLQILGLTLAALALRGHASDALDENVSLVADPGDPVASSPPCLWALKEISGALGEHRIKVGQFASL